MLCLRRLPVILVAILLAACAAERPAAPTQAVSFDAGINYAVDDLLTQALQLPAFSIELAKLGHLIKNDESRGKIVVAPTIDGNTGQQTAASKFLDTRLLALAAARFAQFDVQASAPDVAAKAQFLLSGTLTPLSRSGAAGAGFRINLSLTDLSSNLVVAQSSARVSNQGVDTTPLPFYRDSPSLTKDRVVEGQIRTAQTATGNAADGVYLAHLSINALIAEAGRLYDTAKYAEALRYYEQAAARPDGQQLRVLNGLYLTNTQLGQSAAAEQAFRKIVEVGLATNSLSVKFLFTPGTTDFLADPMISGPYDMWLREVAHEVAASTVCLSVVGNTSHSGPEQLNEQLSLQRAQVIQRRIELLAPQTASRLSSVGMGWRENIVGTGTDDLRDAVDRRVEFRVRACPGSG